MFASVFLRKLLDLDEIELTFTEHLFELEGLCQAIFHTLSYFILTTTLLGRW